MINGNDLRIWFQVTGAGVSGLYLFYVSERRADCVRVPCRLCQSAVLIVSECRADCVRVSCRLCQSAVLIVSECRVECVRVPC